MALPDTIKLAAGTEITVSTSGDFAITLTSLANGSARQSKKIDLTAAWAQDFNVFFESSVAATAVDGVELELYWAGSTSGTDATDNPGSATGSDAAFATPGDYKHQLEYIGSLVLMSAASTGVQRQALKLYPTTQYGSLVVVNLSGQALGSTAGDHKITLTPAHVKVEE